MTKVWTAGKVKEPQEKTIKEQLIAIGDKICDEYCKYPDICLAEKKDPDDAEDLLLEKYCCSCPLAKI